MLAERLGMTVGELLDRMSSQELTEWMLYDRIRGAELEAKRMAAEMKARKAKG